MTGSVAYLECPAGVSGNMLLGAWLDTGISEAVWREMMAPVLLAGVTVEIATVYRQGIRATRATVRVSDEELWYEGDPAPAPSVHPHRHWAEIDALIAGVPGLPDIVRHLTRRAFWLLAEAEGRVHGIAPEQVHFHEVGAYDAIVDIIGAFCGWYLAGSPRCFVSPIEVGGGTVACAHGKLPVPAPAVAILLEGLVTYSSGNWGETVTPTGAAIVRALLEHSQSMGAAAPPLVARAAGYGAGTREFPVANLFRIRLGDEAPDILMPRAGGTVVELTANLDDMSPEWVGDVTQELLAAGALDAWVTPAVMKKGRPGWVLAVLAEPEREGALTDQMLRCTTSLGVRRMERQRTVLERSWQVVATPYGPVRVKIAGRGGDVWNSAPEYEDCRARAQEAGVPLKEVYQAAWTALRTAASERHEPV